jgi:glycosyl hydrolase family 116 (putative beta-glucocerebrosidase)
LPLRTAEYDRRNWRRYRRGGWGGKCDLELWGVLPAAVIGWDGYNQESGQGLPHFQQAPPSGKYPIATVDFEDRALPVSVSLQAFTPFAALNVDDSSLPVAIFKYRINNREKKPLMCRWPFLC